MRLKITLILILFFQFTILEAQTKKGILNKGQNVSSEIAPGQKHRFEVSLDKNQYASFYLMQKGVDLMITTFDSKGVKLDDFDSPNGKNGPELITIKSSVKGNYGIEISPLDEKEPIGNYELKIQNIKLGAVTPNEKVDEIFTQWTNTYSPGTAIAILKDGKMLYKKGYGMANLEYNVPITPSSVFHIASVSKQFTVFAILLLEADGKLSIDDDIRKYIPEVPDFGKKITLRHLASHTSGLRDQWDLLTMAGWRMDDVITKDHILKIVGRQKELNFNPGEEYLYCNTGFTLLAEVVARVSGKTFAEFTKAKIFDPLQMSSTLFYDDNEKIVKNRAYSYQSNSTGYKKSNLNYENVGATSLFTTAEDLSKWALNFSSLKVGNQAIITKMNTPAVLNNGKTFGYAMGQSVGKYRGLNEIQHGGADAGYRSFLARFPDQKLEIIALSNYASNDIGKIAHKIADIYLEGKFEKPPVPEKTDVVKSVFVAPDLLKSYVGDYDLQPGMILSVTESNGQLSAQATAQQAFQLVAVSNTVFEVASVGAKITFLSSGTGKIDTLQLNQGGAVIKAPRIKTANTPVNILTDFEGRFYSDELAAEYRFIMIKEKLTITHNRLNDIKLDSGNAKDIFFGELGEITFVRDANNAITGFKITSGRVRNLWVRKVS
jgi:CubicO group peptidase (beta-lactamase class C family)